MVADDEFLPTEPVVAKSFLVFAIKTAIIAAACVISLIAVLSYLGDLIDDRIAQLDKRIARLQAVSSGAQFWGKIERELDRAASPASEMPAEEKEKLLNDVRVIVARWRPFLEAMTAEMQTPAPPPAK
jgi:hypothetical protein